MSSSQIACPAVDGGGVGKQAPSTSTIVAADAVEGSHILTIHGFSRLKGFSKSGTFNIGDHTWYITYFPEGDANARANPGWISLLLTLAETSGTPLRIHVQFSLLDHTGEPVPAHIWAGDVTFTGYSVHPVPWFIERKVLEESPYLKDDCFRVRCDITVKSHGNTHAAQLIAVPRPDMLSQMGDLLSSPEGVDVTFEVDGETIGAHRLVLAAQSPVFKAQLFGEMKENNVSHIQIDDMEARVFKAMLHFIYNAALPEIDRDDMTAMAQHLLVAADRYGLERLKLICEDKLWYNISTSTLATTLALAEQHGSQGLKQAFFEFLKTTTNLKPVMESDGFEHLKKSFPFFPMELFAELFPGLFIET